MGREGPDQARVSGLSLLPAPGRFWGGMGVLLFLPACAGMGVELVLDATNPGKIIGARVGLGVGAAVGPCVGFGVGAPVTRLHVCGDAALSQ